MVSIEEVEAPEGSTLPGGRVFDFSIVDQDGRDVDLREPVILRLPYEEGLDPVDVAVLDWNEALRRWESIDVVEVDEATNTVAVEIEHLSNKKVMEYLEPLRFIQTAALSLIGEGLRAHYAAGFKHLVSFYVEDGVRVPFLPVVELGKFGFSLVFDLDDLISLPMFSSSPIFTDPLTGDERSPITAEGRDGYMTFWLNGSAALSIAADVTSPVGIKVLMPNTGTDDCCRDPSFDASISAVSLSFPGGEASYLTVNENGKFHPEGAQLAVCPHCNIELKVEASLADISFNILKGELNTGVLADAFGDFTDTEKNTCEEEDGGNKEPAEGKSGVTQGFFASELMCSLFQGSERAIKTLVEKSVAPFTGYEHYTREEIAELDATLFNRITSARGGLDANGDGVGDMVFPHRIPNLLLTVTTTGDIYETRQYFVELRNQQELKEAGWDIRPLRSDNNQYKIEDAPALSVNKTSWIVTTTEDAPSPVEAEFVLVHDGIGPLADETSFFNPMLYKDRTLSDLAIEVTGSPAEVSLGAGTTIDYTATITNLGKDQATGVRLRVADLLGEGLILTRASTPLQTLDCAQEIAAGIICHLRDLDFAETLEVTLQYELTVCREELLECATGVELETITTSFSVESDVEDHALENNSTAVITEVRESPDRAALVALYNAMGGPSWTHQRYWLSGKSVGDWYGVTTDSAGRVIGLDLYYVGIKGPLPAVVGDLTHLQELSIAQNPALSGSLPPELFKLTNLRRLSITGSQLTGELPAELGSLANLEELYLYENDLGGEIPVELASLASLEHLYLSGNHFEGCLPEGLADVAANDLDTLALPDCPPTTVQTKPGTGGTLQPAAFARNPAEDFNGLDATGVNEPWGIWSDGTTMWVAGKRGGRIHAYDMKTRESVQEREFHTPASFPRGLWSDGETMWVAEPIDDKIYAYDVKTKAQAPSQEFPSLAASRNAAGLWSDGVTMWLSNWSIGKIYAYDMVTKARLQDKEFDLLKDVGESDPVGIWSDGAVLWIAARTPAKIYAFDINTFARLPGMEFNTLESAGNHHPNGIWSDGETMWVSDTLDNKLYAYNMPSAPGVSIQPPKPVVETPAFDRDASGDFTGLAAAGNTDPEGIWSDGTTMWVADWSDNKLYAYNMTTKARDAAKHFDTLAAAGITNPTGIWSDGTTMWVTDWSDNKLYAYNLTTKARDAAKDFDTLDAAGNTAPEGLWSDGTTMWVADRDDDKLYAYNMTTKARDAAKDFDTLDAAGNEHPYGVWSDGTTMWVADRDDNEIYAYNLTTKARDAAKHFDTLAAAGNTNPTGIWSDGTTMWVADTTDDKIYAYNMPSAPGVSIQPPKPVVETPAFDRDASGDFTGLAAAGNTDPEGIWSDGTTMWVADWSDNKLYAYNMTTKARDAAKHFDTLAAAGITNPTGIWSDGTTMWVTDWSDNKLYAYNLTTKARDAAKDFDTLDAAGNTAPEGLWSDGTTMWVADRDDDKLYAYNMTTKARDAAKDFDTLDAAGNEHPYGVWSDGTTMWVADRDDNKIYAYNLTTKARDAAKHFDTLAAAGNTNPTGIWSDGTTMWVADTTDDKIYAYNMPSAPGVSIQPPKPVVETPAFDRDASGDFTGLAAAGNTDPEGIWSDGTTMWVADWSDNKLYAYNMTTKARDAAKHFDTLAAAGITNPTGIWSDGTTMWVTDWSDNKLYAYNLTTKARDAAKDFDTLDAAGNTAPEGLWSDGTTMWVADRDDDKLYAYNMTTKARDAAKDFDTLDAAGNEHPYGVWSDGTTMWVADRDDNKIYAYNLTTKARDAAKHFDTLAAAGNTNPTGIWSDGTTMWVADTTDDKIYAYNMPSAPGVSIQPPKPVVETPAFDRDASGDFTGLAAAGNTDPEGIWSDGETMWVSDTLDNKLYAYNMPPTTVQAKPGTGGTLQPAAFARNPAQDFGVLVGGIFGFWSDGSDDVDRGLTQSKDM